MMANGMGRANLLEKPKGSFVIGEYPISLGHEISGTVAALGRGVTTDYIGQPLKEGDRIGVCPAIHCHKCYYCVIAKTPERCTDWKTYGTWPQAGLTICHADMPDAKEQKAFVFDNSLNLVGVDVVINTVGTCAGFAECLGSVRDGGTVVEVGNFVDSGTFPFNPCRDLLGKGIKITAEELDSC